MAESFLSESSVPMRIGDVLAAALCALLVFPRPAIADIAARLDALSIKSFQWEASHAVSINGVPVHVRQFRSSGDAIESARALAAYEMLFQHVVLVPGLIRLSGVHGDAHWLAEISSGPMAGAWGRVSAIALPLSPDADAKLPARDREAFAHADTE